jgi:hypothetical protein
MNSGAHKSSPEREGDHAKHKPTHGPLWFAAPPTAEATLEPETITPIRYEHGAPILAGEGR